MASSEMSARHQLLHAMGVDRVAYVVKADGTVRLLGRHYKDAQSYIKDRLGLADAERVMWVRDGITAGPRAGAGPWYAEYQCGDEVVGWYARRQRATRGAA